MKTLVLILSIILSGVTCFSQWSDGEHNLDTIDFEEYYEFIKIDTSASNLWHIAMPDKVFMDSAYSGNYAIITDSANSYPAGNYSYFDLYIGAFNFDQYYSGSMGIEFKHKYDTDTLKDGGYITISYDQGESWLNIIEYDWNWCGCPAWENRNLYNDMDTLVNGENGFSGNSDGWVTTWLNWYQCLVSDNKYGIGDTTIVRFNFISDSEDSEKEGWLIDDIRLFRTDLSGSVNGVDLSSSIQLFPNPSNIVTTIDLGEAYDNILIRVLDLSGRELVNMSYRNQQTVSIDAGTFTTGSYIILINLNDEAFGVKKWIVGQE